MISLYFRIAENLTRKSRVQNRKPPLHFTWTTYALLEKLFYRRNSCKVTKSSYIEHLSEILCISLFCNLVHGYAKKKKKHLFFLAKFIWENLRTVLLYMHNHMGNILNIHSLFLTRKDGQVSSAPRRGYASVSNYSLFQTMLLLFRKNFWKDNFKDMRPPSNDAPTVEKREK